MGNKIYFYPHSYLRDRQLDTIRRWPKDQVLNPELAEIRRGGQVTRERSLNKTLPISWKQKLPLINVKKRPKGLPKDAVVYVWGAVMSTGPFIVDLDNPYSLTGYNLRAMSIYKGILRRILKSRRCVEIRCMSQACRETLRILFGDEIYTKSSVHYPYMQQYIHEVKDTGENGCRFLFIGTQFEIKGGAALLRAFKKVYDTEPSVHLDMITHLPPEYHERAVSCPGITIYDANFSRDEIFEKFMRNADVLVHPTYVESFGMVVLEALAHGLAIIATDVYALREMVEDSLNGILLRPPLSIWDGYIASEYYYKLATIKPYVAKTDTSLFEENLAVAMLRFAQDHKFRLSAQKASLDIINRRFSVKQ
ncbi:MAG: glycosyltransferase [Nitrospirota bacterium]